MGIRFVVGRARSGKTAWCRQHILDACHADPLGPPIFLIVPRQATFQAERDLVCGTDLGAVFRVRVTSFDLLGRDILAECGGDAIPQIDALGRRMILGHLLRRHQGQLRFFQSVARQPGLAARLDATLSELERAGQSIDEVAAALVESGSPGDDLLAAKIHDLKLIYGAYADYLGNDRLDPHRRLQQVLKCIEDCRTLRGARVFIDDFDDFTAYERHVIAALATVCEQVDLTLLLDPASPVLQDPHQFPPDLSPFYPVEMAYRRLRLFLESNGIQPDDTVALQPSARGTTTAGPGGLARLREALFHNQPDAPPGDVTDVRLIEAPDPLAEVDAVAREIHDLTRAGLRLRDIVVLARDLEPYLALIDGAFREHRIAYFADRRRTVVHHPVIQLLRGALAIVESDWSHDACMELLKSGLCGLGDAEVDALENYCLQHALQGPQAWLNPEAWAYDPRPREEDAADPAPSQADTTMDQLRRRVADPLARFASSVNDEQATVRTIVTAIYRLFDDYQVRAALLRWIHDAAREQHHEQRAEHEQTWAVLNQLSDQLVALLGDERVSLSEFSSILESGLESFDLALTPQTVDQVLVGSIDRTRTPAVKAAMILGLNAGIFPHRCQEDSILSDAERRMLGARQIELSPDSQRRVLDENFLAYRALTRASHHLILTRPAADATGRTTLPSPYWDRVLALLNPPVQSLTPQEADDPGRIGTPRQLITHLMRWVRNGEAPARQSGTSAALYQWLSAHGCCDDSVDLIRCSAWRALGDHNHAMLDPATARQLWGETLDATAAQIESFVRCPFQHFGHYGLRLGARPDGAVDGRDTSAICHRVLDRLARQLQADHLQWTSLDDREESRRLNQLSEQIGSTFRQQIMLSDARNSYLLQRLKTTLQRVGQNQRAQLQRSDFQPIAAGVRFADGAQLSPHEFTTSKGRTVRLSGRIDRIDATDQFAAAIDYRLGHNKLSLQEAYYGLALQLLVYLVVLQHQGEKLLGRPLQPVAAFNLGLFRATQNVHHPNEVPEPDSPEFRLVNKRRGVIDRSAVTILDTTLHPGDTSAVMGVTLNKDGAFAKGGDALDSETFAALIRHAEHAIAHAADDILDGKIDVFPYRLNDESPCAQCELMDVCRFDPARDPYRYLPPLKANDIVEILSKNAP